MRVCSAPNCQNVYLAKGVCRKHYEQIRAHGRILTATPYEPNEIYELEDYAELVLRNRHGAEILRCKIDLEDANRVRKYKWHSAKGYPKNDTVGYLHHFILGIKTEIDHILGPSDNRKRNLRLASHSENVYYQRIRRNNTSGFKGVSWAAATRKWVVQITKDGRHTWVGAFNDKIEAALAYDRMAERTFGDFAMTNQKLGLL